MNAFPAALYLHIPYCRAKCDYCDFYSVCDMGSRSLFFESLNRQIAELKKQYSIESFRTVYLGGGTPALSEPEQLERLFDFIKPLNGGSLPPEVTMECNPSNVSRDSLQAWRDVGINRLSLGVQTFQDRFLEKAGRRSSRKAILAALKHISTLGDFNVSLDLIQGLPGMNEKEQLSDLEEALGFEPDHLSWYGLILEEETVLAEEWESRNDLIEADEAEVWSRGCKMLKDKGYDRYEISNFAKPGRQSNHNSIYWKMEPYLGCGPSAVSMLADKEGWITRFRTAADADAFADGRIIYEDMEPIAAGDFVKDYLLMGLRIREGIDLHSFQRIFDCSLSRLVPASLERWHKDGCLEIRDDHLCPTEKGMDLLNSILVSIFHELDGNPFPLALNWPLP